MMTAALVHSHHLLDHKPDNLLLKGGKFKLRGVACLGRPGVALCVGDDTSIDNFQASLESAMPQKKFGRIDLSEDDSLARIEGFESASLGELRAILDSIGAEEHFFALTGIDPSTATGTNKASGNKKNTGRGKKKR